MKNIKTCPSTEGEILRDFRTKHGIVQIQLSGHAKRLSPSRISAIEKGHIPLTRTDFIKIKNAFELMGVDTAPLKSIEPPVERLPLFDVELGGHNE